MVRELAAERALDNGFLESADRRLELLVRDRSLPDKLVENLGRDRRRSFRRLAFRFAVHRHSSCYAPHTKFLTPSPAFGFPMKSRSISVSVSSMSTSRIAFSVFGTRSSPFQILLRTCTTWLWMSTSSTYSPAASPIRIPVPARTANST